MALDFPIPILNQVYNGPGGLYWVWDGVKWLAGSSTGTSIPAPPPVLLVTATITLPGGFVGVVRVENSTSAPITIGLPGSPFGGQKVTVKDTLGNAGTYPITVAGNGSNIEAAASVTLMFAYSWVELVYVGGKWVQI